MANVFAEDLALVIGSMDLRNESSIQFPLVFNKTFRQIPIEELCLKTRAINVLKRHRIMNMGNLLDNMADLVHFRNCGKDTVKEIKNSFLQVWYENTDSETKVEFWEEFINLNKLYT